MRRARPFILEVISATPSDVRLQRGTRSTLVEPGYPGRSCDFCQGPLMFLCFRVLIDARSSMPNPSEKIGRCNVPPEGGTLHRLFQSAMPNHRCPIIDAQSIGKIGRCNVPPEGGTLHQLFQSSMPDHRCPIHRRKREV